MLKKHAPGRLWATTAAAITLAAALIAPAATPLSASASPPSSGQSPFSDQSNASGASRAMDVLMSSYDPVKAWWPSSWWNSAVAMQTVEDYMLRTGDERYLPAVDNTFEKNKGVFPAGELSGDPILGHFTSRAIDDSAWWGLTWVAAYDLTGNRKYLDEAVTIAEYVHEYWDTSTCGGGVWWDAEKTYKNSVTTGLYVRLTAELHNRIRGDSTWLGRSETAWSWFTSSGLINSSFLVNDGLSASCQNNGQTVWSYNQGLAIGAGIELWRANHDPLVRSTARKLADAAITSPKLVTEGVLTESCDAIDRTCDDNAKQFKGVFIRYLMDAFDATHEPRYGAFLEHQAWSIWTNDRDAGGRFGQRWSGSDSANHPNARDWRTQASALSALIAVVPPRQGHGNRWLSAALSPTQSAVMPSAGAAAVQGLALAVWATAPKDARVQVSAQAPAGWTVTPSATDLTVHSDGTPAQATVPLSVTVPAGTAEGDYEVSATVSSAGATTMRAMATVRVAHAIDFETGTAAELPWLSDAGGSQSGGAGNRFADNDRYFVYRFPLPADTTGGTVTLSIDNEFLVQASSDGQTWTTVLTESREIRDGSNKADRTVNIGHYLGTDKTVYIRVADSFPQDGWGGRVSHVSATLSCC